MMRTPSIAVIVLALVSGIATQAPSQTTAPLPAAEEASLRGFGDADKTCQEWTDVCATCQRSETGAPVCSNIGIACQPKAISCTKRVEQPKSEPPK